MLARARWLGLALPVEQTLVPPRCQARARAECCSQILLQVAPQRQAPERQVAPEPQLALEPQVAQAAPERQVALEPQVLQRVHRLAERSRS